MLLADIQTNVDTITDRPDRVNERNLAIQEATLELHAIETWWRDEVEQPVVFSANANYQQIALINLPRFRTFRYLRKYDPAGVDPITQQATGAPGDFFLPRKADKILDPYGQTEDNIYYLTGGGSTANGVCQLRSTVAFQFLNISWMTFPIVSPLTSYNSWIADLYPYAIITRAALKLKKYITDSDSAKLLVGDAQTHYQNLLVNALEFSSR